jgi:transcriptional regulator with XRE-family HTH domain
MKKSIYTAESAELREILREARRQARLSQRDLAAKLAVSPSWVAKVEIGERRIDLIEFGWFIAACGGDVPSAFARVARMFPAARVVKGGRPA